MKTHLWTNCVHGFFDLGPVGHQAYLEVIESIHSINSLFISIE